MTISVSTEGAGDLYVLPTLVERAASDVLREDTRLDVDVLPPLESRRPAGATFRAWLAGLEQRQHADLYVVHQDSDKEEASEIVRGRWATWLGDAAEPRRWVIAIPVRSTESWMLADHEVLASTLALPHGRVVDRIGRSADTDAVRRPKHVVTELLAEAGVVNGWTMRFGAVAASWSERASAGRLTLRSRSYADFAGRLSTALHATLMGDPDR